LCLSMFFNVAVGVGATHGGVTDAVTYLNHPKIEVLG